MENKSIEDIGVGDKKPKKYLKPTKVKIVSYGIENKQGNDCLIVSVDHPDSKDNLKISGVKMKRFNKLKQNGLWVSLDEDGKFPYESAIAEFLRKVGVDCIKDLIGKEVETDIISIDNPLLVFKCY